MEMVEVQLAKNQQGLGITVAGYVCEKEEISGIFIKSITKGSAADVCGKLQVNDQIIEVDGRALQGYTNHQAVEVLRNTGKEVKLCLARYLRGAKYEKLQQAISTGEFCVTATTQAQVHEPKSNTFNLASNDNQSQNECYTCYNYTLPVDSKTEAEIQARWKRTLGEDCTIVVAQLSKFEDNGGLGISLEGTVDVENGREVRPHHYIGSILSTGPVGKNGSLCSGDELLEANGKILLGLNHKEVVTTLKELPKNVCLVCARHSDPSSKDFHMSPIYHSTPKKSNIPCGKLTQKEVVPRRLVKAKSDGYLIMGLSLISSVHTILSKLKSRSLEPLTNLATWSSESQIVELVKGDNGLGFSVLDYQDPMNLNETVIVVRSLVPGGVAQQDGRLIPGDRLLFVNDFNLENASLDTAVHALQGVPKGLVRIGIAKPLPCPESSFNTQTPLDDSSDSKELLSDNCPKSINASSSFDSGEILDEQMWRIPLRQTSLTPSSLLSGGFDSSCSTSLSSPAFSPSVTKSGDDSIPPLPSALERIVRIKKGTNKLGLSVELVEKGINGMIVKSIAPDSALEKDGNISVGDYVLSVNNESMRKITKSQARAILKRVELLNTDIIIKYVPGPDAAVYHQSVMMNLQQGRESPSIILPRQLSPRIFPKYYRSPFFQPKVHEDTTDGELSEGSIIRSLPLSEHLGSYEQILSPYTATSGLSTIPTPSSFSTDFSELKQSEEICYSEDDENKDITMEETFQLDLSEEKVEAAEQEQSTEKTISPSFAEIRAIFLNKSASQPPVPSQPVKKSSLTSPDIVLNGITDVASEDGTQETLHANKSLTSKETLVSSSRSQSLSLWGPKRLVEIWKEPSSNLGIVIAKGIVNIGQSTSDSTISGIFIKSVLPNSPADKTGAIKSGDRILEVNDIDVDGVGYEEAVELIKSAKNPVKFLLQSPLSADVPDNSPDLYITETLVKPALVKENKKEMSPVVEHSSSISLIPDPLLLAPRRLSDKIEILSTSIEGSDEEEDNEDNRQIQGKIYSKKGYEIDRASAAFLKLMPEEITDDEEEDDYGYTEKKIKKKYGDMNGEIVIVELQKGVNGLGLSLAGNKDRTKMSVFVCGIHPSGSAAKDGRIRIGDELLEVNGLVLYGRCHLNASAMIKGLSGNVYKMIFLRKEDVLDDMAIKPLTQFPMYLAEETQEERFAKYGSVRKVTTRKGPQGLGIMIIEGKHSEVGQGIFISDIQDGSPAKQAGLNVGDMILAVNQTELIGSDYDTAATVLKQVDGSITMVVANPNKSGGADKKDGKGSEQSERTVVRRLSKKEKTLLLFMRYTPMELLLLMDVYNRGTKSWN